MQNCPNKETRSESIENLPLQQLGDGQPCSSQGAIATRGSFRILYLVRKRSAYLIANYYGAKEAPALWDFCWSKHETISDHKKSPSDNNMRQAFDACEDTPIPTLEKRTIER